MAFVKNGQGMQIKIKLNFGLEITKLAKKMGEMTFLLYK